MNESPLVRVARNLREIETLHQALRARAIDQGGHALMPGGLAMVALAPVGDPDEWGENIAAEELHHLSACPRESHVDCRYAEHVADEDGTETALQTLLFWSEQWRVELGYPLDGRRPTETSEARFIRWALDWAWDNELHWADFQRDMADARRWMENLLVAGVRSDRGAPCLYDECKGVRLVRKLTPRRGSDGEKAWDFTNWHCPKCKRSWDDDAYARHVTAAHERAKFEEIDGETWCTPDYAARRVGRPESTVRVWLHRGLISAACIIAGRRTRFVRLADVEQRHAESQRRERAS